MCKHSVSLALPLYALPATDDPLQPPAEESYKYNGVNLA
mgnify:CR=1 FL=1